MTVEVDVQYAYEGCAEEFLPSVAQIEHWVAEALPQEARDTALLTIRIVALEEGQQLNERYRNGSGATNVLSFPYEGPQEAGLSLLGDIVICAPVVAAQAREQHKTAQAHWCHLVVHGLLHLVGYDHIDEGDAEAMEALEIDILGRLDFANPYE